VTGSGKVISRGLSLAALGIVAGLIASAMIIRLFSALLFGVAATNVPTYAISCTVLLVICIVSSCLPARRAMRVDPMIALRAE
jgi:ABC-type antimicrobial peptide transport system permease subunit